MNRSILIVICDFIITSMIYLNGGFSAIESQPYDGRPADRSTMNIIVSQLDAHRAALEQARAELIAQKSAAQDSEKKTRELERISNELASTRARLEYIQRSNSLNAENAGVMTKADMQKELADEILHKNMAQAKFELLQQQLEAAQDGQVRSDDNLKALQRQNAELLKQQAELIRSNASMMQAKEAELRAKDADLRAKGEELRAKDADLRAKGEELRAKDADLRAKGEELRSKGEELAITQQNVAKLNERLSGQSSQFNQALQQKDQLLKQRAEELRRKDAEIAKRNQQLGDAGSQLQQTQKQLSATANELTGVKKDLERAQGELKNTRSSLKKLEEKQQQELKAAEQRYQIDHNRQQKNMEALRGELKDVRNQHEAVKKENADQRAALAQERERNLASERALAEAKDELSRSNDNLKKMSQQYSQAQGRVSSMQKVVENSASKLAELNRRQQEQQQKIEELRKVNEQLHKQTDFLKDADAKLKAADSKLKETEKKLKFLLSDVAKKSHTQALVEVKMSLKQGRGLGLSRQVETTNFLPVLKIGSGQYVVTALENLTSYGNSESQLSNISSLSFIAGKPKSSGSLLTGPILLEKSDPRVAFMAVNPISNVTPLPVITRSELWREHSSLNIYLFKAGKLASANLLNRCRWGVGNDRCIYVTNSESRAANEVKAEVGDILITPQGFCAGVVVAVNDQEACCYLFETEPRINEMHKIEFGSRQDGHGAFSKGLKHWVEQNSRLNKK